MDKIGQGQTVHEPSSYLSFPLLQVSMVKSEDFLIMHVFYLSSHLTWKHSHSLSDLESLESLEFLENQFIYFQKGVS